MGAPAGKVEGLNCPNCGAPQTIRTLGHAVTVVCPNCHAILDAKDPRLKVLQLFQERLRFEPAIPLGTRGKLRNTVYEVVGFQVRTTESEGVVYSWREYVLFNPYKGFRYLTEYDGHWNDVAVIDAVPDRTTVRNRPGVSYLGKRYARFQGGEARTAFVLGEFPWQVRVGEQVQFEDYIAPPEMLSAESTAGETTWSLGEYIAGARVWEAFQLPGRPLPAIGVFENQPAPSLDLGGMWTACMFLLLALCVLALGFSTFSRNQEVFRGSYSLNTSAFVTDVFELQGRPSDVQVSTVAPRDVEAYFHYALIDADNGRAWDFGRELNEGRDVAVVPHVPAGKYYLRVEPEVAAPLPSSTYQIAVRRDVPVAGFYWLAGLALLAPTAIRSLRAGGFEARRWRESDYGN
ncbi:MAG: DUF4178 domain-containing protein [Acidobacteria bacterium]|nr:DUF4178 domain-containing protein [Acidobacteriota bacterium]